MINLNQPPSVQGLTMFFRSELQSARFRLRQEISQNPNLMGNSPASNRVLFEAGSTQNPNLAADDGDDIFRSLGNISWLPDESSPGLYGLEMHLPSRDFSPPAYGKAFQELMIDKDPKSFLAIMKTGEAVRAESVGVIEVIVSIPTNPAERQAYFRGLAYGSRFHDTNKQVLKLCTTGHGGGSLLGLQSSDLADTYVDDFSAIKQLWSSASEKSLTDFIGQVEADCAKKLGPKAAAEFLEMVENCPREVLANFYSVELWHMLVLEDKLKEEFGKLLLCKRPEIIDPPPAASIIHPIPDVGWKPSSSTTADQGGVKFFLPDLNERYVEDDEAGKSTVDFAIDEEEKKASSKKRKAEAASGEGEDHVPKMPTFPAANSLN